MNKSQSLKQFIFEVLKDLGPIDRTSLSKEINLPRTTLFDYLSLLIKEGVVIKFPENKIPGDEPRGLDRRGRPKVLFDIKEGY